MSNEDLVSLYNPQNANSNQYKNATMWFYNGVVDVTMPIGVRIHGSLSRTYVKKSLKVDFGDQKIYQIKGFYLKAAASDPSYAREILSTAVTYRFEFRVVY
jgi:hypothetical protein